MLSDCGDSPDHILQWVAASPVLRRYRRSDADALQILDAAAVDCGGYMAEFDMHEEEEIEAESRV